MADPMTEEEKRAILNCIIYDKNLANNTGKSILELSFEARLTRTRFSLP